MKLLFGLITLLLLALAGGRRLHGRLPFTRRFFLVGGEFLVLGWALGEQGLGLLDARTLEALRPLLLLGLGWIGLLVGLQFEFHILRRVPGSFSAVAVMQGLLVLGALFAALLPLLRAIFGDDPTVVPAALFLAAAGADSSQHILALALREKKRQPHVPDHLYRFCAEIDTLIPLFALALLAGLRQELVLAPEAAAAMLPALRWLGLAILLGGLLGLLLALFLKGVEEGSHHLLVLVGFLAFSGGLGQALGFPPLFVNFVAGVVTVNLLGHHRDTWTLAAASERPFYFIFLLLVGASWTLVGGWVLILALVFFALRILAKVGALALAGRVGLGRGLLPARAGLALSGQSGVSVALVASFQFSETGAVAQGAYAAILLAFLLSTLVSPGLTLRGLTREAQP